MSLEQLIDRYKRPDFNRIVTASGYETLLRLKNIYQKYIEIMTIRGIYHGTAEILIQNAELDEFLRRIGDRSA